MATFCQDRADAVRVSLQHHYEHFPSQPPDTRGEREAFVFERAATVFRVLATFEDRFRKFFDGLLREHRRE
ncbi:MAG: hypothetical protein WD472_11360 [Dehalococcoidia bacterium]